MGTNTDWNPELYLKFNKERIQPSIDLVSRIAIQNPARIIDIGCGPGNSTQILHQRWPFATITGADNSPAMIQKARADYPDQSWLLFDAEKDELDEKFDIVFSNATIQWIPDHKKLIGKFAGLLNDRGILAVQMPLFFSMDIGKALQKISGESKWRYLLDGVRDLFTFNTPSFYYDQTSVYFSDIDLWVTDYFHVMKSHQAILEMIRSAGLKPYLERISDETERAFFEQEVLDAITRDYPVQDNGNVFFPFKRLFFVSGKKMIDTKTT